MSKSKQFSEVLREWSEVFMKISMRESIRFWKDSGLSMPQISALMRLHHHGACGVSEIGSHLGVTNAAASQMVQRLVQARYLERAEDPNDRRAKQLTLTPKARKLLEGGFEARRRWLETLIQELAPAQQAEIATALTYLTEAARKLEA